MLAILNYGGRIFPSWLLNPLLPKLTTLTLNFCTEPNFLPPFGQLPYLKFLEISCSRVKNVGDELSTYSLLADYGSSKHFKEPSYPSLEVLTLRNTLNLEEWQAHDGDFPCLKELHFKNCPELLKIAIIPPEVREVTFMYCPKLKLLTCPSVIKRLMIHKCGFCEIMFESISERLIISKCVELVSINWMNGGLNSIRLVCFEYCPKIKLVTIPVGTSELKIYKCGFREIMFWSVYENLTINNCEELISINWMDKGLDSCDRLSSLSLLSVQSHSSTSMFLVILKCPRLSVLEGFHGLMKLKTVELLRGRYISILIADCPLMRDWCQRNSITYTELSF